MQEQIRMHRNLACFEDEIHRCFTVLLSGGGIHGGGRRLVHLTEHMARVRGVRLRARHRLLELSRLARRLRFRLLHGRQRRGGSGRRGL